MDCLFLCSSGLIFALGLWLIPKVSVSSLESIPMIDYPVYLCTVSFACIESCLKLLQYKCACDLSWVEVDEDKLNSSKVFALIITSKCHTNYTKIKKECVIDALYVVLAAYSSAFWLMAVSWWQNKALLGVMATLHAMIALSDGPNKRKSCPLHVIGQCNNLQTSCIHGISTVLNERTEKGGKLRSSS